MPKRFLNVVVLPEDGGEVRSFRLPARSLRTVLYAAAAVVLALGISFILNMKSIWDVHVLQTLRAENLALQGELEEFRTTVAELEEGIEWTGQREREARLLAGLDPIDEETRRLGIGGPMLRDTPPTAIKNADIRAVLRDEGLRLDNLVRQVLFQKTSYSEVLANLLDRKEELAHTPTISPVLNGYTITSGYGPRRDPFTGRRAQHNGLDFRAVAGTPVVVTADGTVSFVGRNGDFGLAIEVKHGSGIETAYCHLKSASVRPGQEVKRGERIGKVGSSGRSTGSHLHYEVRVDGHPVNPKKYILTPSVIVD